MVLHGSSSSSSSMDAALEESIRSGMSKSIRRTAYHWQIRMMHVGIEDGFWLLFGEQAI